MRGKRKFGIGKFLTLAGCIWFVLAFIWISPLQILMTFVEPIWRAPYEAYRMVARVEFPIAAMTAATGVLLWRQVTRKLSLSDYVMVFAGAGVAVLAVFRFNGWLHL